MERLMTSAMLTVVSYLCLLEYTNLCEPLTLMSGNTLTVLSTESSPTNGTPDADNEKGTEGDISKEVFQHGNAFWVVLFLLFLCAGGSAGGGSVLHIILGCVLLCLWCMYCKDRRC